MPSERSERGTFRASARKWFAAIQPIEYARRYDELAEPRASSSGCSIACLWLEGPSTEERPANRHVARETCCQLPEYPRTGIIIRCVVFRPPNEKPLHWIGSAKRDFLGFPATVKDDMGNALGIAQFGGTAPTAKP